MFLYFYLMLHQFQTVPLDILFWKMKIVAPGLFPPVLTPPFTHCLLLAPLLLIQCEASRHFCSMLWHGPSVPCFVHRLALQNITSESHLIFMFIDGMRLLITFGIKTLCQWKENAFRMNIERLLLLCTPLIA